MQPLAKDLPVIAPVATLDEQQAIAAAVDGLLTGSTKPTSIVPRTPSGQRFLTAWQQGRVVECPPTGDSNLRGGEPYIPVLWMVEYKADTHAAKIQHVFIETLDEGAVGGVGWAYGSRAEMLVYYIPEDKVVYAMRFVRLRNRLREWKDVYGERSRWRDGIHTRGVDIPPFEMENWADVVIRL